MTEEEYLQRQPPENAEPQSSQDIFMKMSEVGRKGALHTL